MSTSNAATTKAYARFSLARVWALATNTVTQLVRMKILWFLAAFALIVIIFSFAFSSLTGEEQLKQLKAWSLGILSVFSIVIAIAGTALLLPRDVEDRTLYTILSKPVPRHEYLIGKLFGVILLLAGGLIIMDITFSVVVWIKEQVILSGNLEALQREQHAGEADVEAMKAWVGRNGLTWSLQQGVWCIFLKAAVVAAFSLMLSCLATSTLFTIVVGFLFAIAGHGESLLRDFAFKSLAVVWKKILAILLAILCPDLGVFDLLSPIIAGDSIPGDVLLQVTTFGIGYVVLYGAVAHLLFSDKEL